MLNIECFRIVARKDVSPRDHNSNPKLQAIYPKPQAPNAKPQTPYQESTRVPGVGYPYGFEGLHNPPITSFLLYEHVIWGGPSW